MPKKAPKNKETDGSEYQTREFGKMGIKEAKGPWICEHPDCDAYENEDPDTEECEACGEPRYAEIEDKYSGFKCGIILSIEAIDDKLKHCTIDIGDGEAKAVKIVTNAPNATEGARVVVACVGATVGDVKLTKKTVGGRPSEGMLCDPPMLGWTGGAAGLAALVPDTFAPGAKPPEKRPRMDGK